MAKKNAPVKKEIDFVDMTVAELSDKVRELKKQVASFKLEKSVGKTRNLKTGFLLRKQLARVLTIQTAKLATEKRGR